MRGPRGRDQAPPPLARRRPAAASTARRSRRDPAGVTAAIGPLPAIYIRPATDPAQPRPAAQLWHSAVREARYEASRAVPLIAAWTVRRLALRWRRRAGRAALDSHPPGSRTGTREHDAGRPGT